MGTAGIGTSQPLPVGSLALKEDKSNKGAASGYAPLDSGSKVPVTNLPAATGAAAGTQSAADYTKLAALPSAAQYAIDLAGKQAKTVVVHDAAFNAASVTVTGLSSAKRYRIFGTIDPNGTGGWAVLKPNGEVYGAAGVVVGVPTYLLPIAYFAGSGGTENKRGFCITIEPRRDGLAAWNSQALCGDYTNPETIGSVGYGSIVVDLTSVLCDFGSVRTGWLTIIEETP
jgi:hypothetical protein